MVERKCREEGDGVGGRWGSEEEWNGGLTLYRVHELK